MKLRNQSCQLILGHYIFLLNELCQVDHKRMFQHIIHLIHLIEKQDNLSELHDLVKAIEELIKKLMRDDRE